MEKFSERIFLLGTRNTANKNDTKAEEDNLPSVSIEEKQGKYATEFFYSTVGR